MGHVDYRRHRFNPSAPDDCCCLIREEIRAYTFARNGFIGQFAIAITVASTLIPASVTHTKKAATLGWIVLSFSKESYARSFPPNGGLRPCCLDFTTHTNRGIQLSSPQPVWGAPSQWRTWCKTSIPTWLVSCTTTSRRRGLCGWVSGG